MSQGLGLVFNSFIKHLVSLPYHTLASFACVGIMTKRDVNRLFSCDFSRMRLAFVSSSQTRAKSVRFHFKLHYTITGASQLFNVGAVTRKTIKNYKKLSTRSSLLTRPMSRRSDGNNLPALNGHKRSGFASTDGHGSGTLKAIKGESASLYRHLPTLGRGMVDATSATHRGVEHEWAAAGQPAALDEPGAAAAQWGIGPGTRDLPGW
jgi:hypothetical protein